MAFAFYKLVVRLYGLVIHLAAAFNQKARQWVDGRKNWQHNLRQKVEALGTAERYWFHCASYGEFEQGRPLIEAIRLKHPSSKIVLSFFSPSGYEAFKNWSGADVIVYLPLDTIANANVFLEIIAPKKAFIIKYEYWLCFLSQLKAKQIPTFLISATFKPSQVFFKSYGGIFRQSLSTFSKLFIQDQNSLNLLQTIGIRNAVLSGDTRVDRVLAIKEQAFSDVKIQAFVQNQFVLIAGSTWHEDDKFLTDALSEFALDQLKIIVAPHELSQSSVRACIAAYSKIDPNLSVYSDSVNQSSRILILDTMGMLAKVYRYGNIAYVGGGFGSGIHNVLEPAVYGIPVCISGKGHEKYNEAVQLMQQQIVFNCSSAQDLQKTMLQFKSSAEARDKVKTGTEHYFEANKMVTQRIINAL